MTDITIDDYSRVKTNFYVSVTFNKHRTEMKKNLTSAMLLNRVNNPIRLAYSVHTVR